MSELPERVPDEIVFASFNNQLIERTFQRYATEAQRSALEPAPEDGSISFVESTLKVEIWSGSAWVEYIQDPEFLPFAQQVALNKASLSHYTTQLFTPYQEYGGSGLRVGQSSNPTIVDLMTIGSAGDYLWRACYNMLHQGFQSPIHWAVVVNDSRRASWEDEDFGGGTISERPQATLRNLKQNDRVWTEIWEGSTTVASSVYSTFAWLAQLPEGLI